MKMDGQWVTVGTRKIWLAERTVALAAQQKIMSSDHPRLFSIPAGAAFLPTLADAVLLGTLVPGTWPGTAIR